MAECQTSGSWLSIYTRPDPSPVLLRHRPGPDLRRPPERGRLPHRPHRGGDHLRADEPELLVRVAAQAVPAEGCGQPVAVVRVCPDGRDDLGEVPLDVLALVVDEDAVGPAAVRPHEHPQELAIEVVVQEGAAHLPGKRDRERRGALLRVDVKVGAKPRPDRASVVQPAVSHGECRKLLVEPNAVDWERKPGERAYGCSVAEPELAEAVVPTDKCLGPTDQRGLAEAAIQGSGHKVDGQSDRGEVLDEPIGQPDPEGAVNVAAAGHHARRGDNKSVCSASQEANGEVGLAPVRQGLLELRDAGCGLKRHAGRG
ncbi:hypothetical protein J8273_1289 [Carpediemonas membranifera]|uniref:Uncharacterized protein n=1 Tax=Carpediemonas membranifera TaxID=201153 RepID=A0A8J6B0Y7_9EUKA|nr:hypothetical protein J8273_1289 [Carpediemonas membranifera]|eukprot:KAG9396950.1 hypothetical protein J8273_1289 [Carpediemonas membranifera]